MPLNNLEQVVTVSEYARLRGVTPQAVRFAIQAKRLQARKAGGCMGLG